MCSNPSHVTSTIRCLFRTQLTLFNVHCTLTYYVIYIILYIILYNILLQNEEVCGNTIYTSSEASGVNHIIHRSQRLR